MDGVWLDTVWSITKSWSCSIILPILSTVPYNSNNDLSFYHILQTKMREQIKTARVVIPNLVRDRGAALCTVHNRASTEATCSQAGTAVWKGRLRPMQRTLLNSSGEGV